MSNTNFLTKEQRRLEAAEFYNWPLELIDMLFKHSKAVMDNPWFRYHPDPKAIQAFYACPFYNIRQLSYTTDQESMLPGQQSRIECDEIINSKPEHPVLEIGAGNGDISLYLALNGIPVIATEHSGTPVQFLKWRFNKYNCNNITILDENDKLPDIVGPVICYSTLDHIYNNLEFTRKLCLISKGKIYARPNIGPEFALTRPETHDPEILKTVPDCFKLIEEHNAKCQP